MIVSFRKVRAFLALSVLALSQSSMFAQYTWYVDPGAVITGTSAAGDMIIEGAPTANFNIDFDTGGDPPRLVGTDIAGSFDTGFHIGYTRSGWSGSIQINYTVDYRVSLKATNDPNEWVVVLDWHAKSSLGWSRSGTNIPLWKVNKNNPTTPISVSNTQTSTNTTPPTNISGADTDENGWDDSTDVAWWNNWNDVPEGTVNMPDPTYIDSSSANDFDHWFDADSGCDSYNEVAVEDDRWQT